MKFNEEKLKKAWPDVFPTDLNSPAKIEDNDKIIIFQHPCGNSLSSSSSHCQIISKFKHNNYYNNYT